MPARTGADYPDRRDSLYATAWDHDGRDIRTIPGTLPDLWQEREIQTLFELSAPDVEHRAVTFEDGRRVLFLLGADNSWARVEEADGAMTVHQDGPNPLWDVLDGVRRRWVEYGRFGLDSLRAEITSDDGALTAPGNWRFAA